MESPLYDRNLVLLPIKGLRHSVVSFYIAAGSRYESKDDTGLAHLLEHTLMASDVFDYYQTYAETQIEYLRFTTQQLSEDTIPACKRLFKKVFSPHINLSILETQKGVIAAELGTSVEDLYKQTLEILFGTASPQSRGHSGQITKIQSFSLSDIERYRTEYVIVPRAVCVVSGDFDIDEMRRSAEELGILHRNPRITTSHTVKDARTVYQTFLHNEMTTLRIFIPTPGISQYGERAKLDILRACFAGYDFSLLNNLLRQELGVAYRIESDSKYYTAGGYLQFGYATLSKHAESVAERVHKILRGLPDTLNGMLMEKARKRVLFDYVYAVTDSELSNDWYGENALLSQTPASIHEMIAYVEKSTLKDIQMCAETYCCGPYATIQTS